MYASSNWNTQVFHTGVFAASIHFNQPVNVSWLAAIDRVVPIGYFSLDNIYANNKRAPINDSTKFYITNETAFGEFSQKLINSQNFTWRLECDSLTVQALKFPVSFSPF